MVGITRETDNHDVLQAISVHIVSQVDEAIAVANARDEFTRHANFMNLPRGAVSVFRSSRLWSLIPDISGDDIN